MEFPKGMTAAGHSSSANGWFVDIIFNASCQLPVDIMSTDGSLSSYC